MEKVFSIYNQDQHLYPLVISMPHSGTQLTQKMKDNLIEGVILPNMDCYIPLVYDFLKEMNITVIENHMSRYVIDPNRSLKDNHDTSYKTNLIYRQTTLGYPMYQKDLLEDEINERIELFYKPYHQAIENALNEKKKYFSKVYLIDLHSFGADLGTDIILGNKNNQTMNKKLFQKIHQLLEKQGFRVRDNTPFQGGYITRHYGKENVESLQIEMWYQKYIANRYFGNEESPEIDDHLMNQTRKQLHQFFIKLLKILDEN